MASPPRNRRGGLQAPAPPLPGQTSILTDDDLLADILIRLPTLAELGRACTVCASFRRVITDPSFLRRLRAIHPPLLLGLLPSAGGFHAAEPPHPSAPVARALARAADFAFSFLPSPGRWVVRDVRYGRVLLDRDDRRDGIFTKLAVCDPLFRRYVLLPPIPEELAASVQQPHRVDLQRGCEVFLAPCGEEENAAAAQTTFTVIWMAQCPSKLVALTFSSVAGQWRAIVSPSWRDLNPAKSVTARRVLFFRSYAYRCFYWMMAISTNLLVLDMGRMEFSVLKLPSGHSGQESTIVEAGEGRLGMFALSGYMGCRKLDLFSTIGRKEGECANEWKPEGEVIAPSSYRYFLLGAGSGRVLIQGTLEFVDDDDLAPNYGCISLEFNTLQHERVCRMIDDALHPLPFLSYPPSLSSLSI